jgi:hypothetical protein
MRFVSGEEQVPAALGFVADVDAVEVRFAYPPALLTRCAAEGPLLRGLRVARFRDLLRNDGRLDGIVNRFQRDWLSEAYLAALSGIAAEDNLAPEQAATALENNSAKLGATLERMFQWVAPGEDEAGDEDTESNDPQNLRGTTNEDGKPRRLAELLHAASEPSVRAALGDAAPTLWRHVDTTWQPWLHARYKATLSVAVLEAFSVICPQIDAGVVLEDLEAHANPLEASEGDRIWLTESTIGGGGAIEAFFRAYVEDPRHFFRLLEASLGPSELEGVAAHLERIVDQAAGPNDAPIPSAIDILRAARGHKQTLAAVDSLRTVLAAQGIIPNPSLLVAFSARLLRPGAGPNMDRLLAGTLRSWHELEERLGFDVDVRVFASMQSRHAGLEAALGIPPPGGSSEEHAAWRYSVFRSLLWARGSALRAESLRVSNPFLQAPSCDRLLVIGTLPRTVVRVALDTKEWFQAVATALTADGVVELATGSEGSKQLAGAIQDLGAQPVDTGGLLLHCRLAGVRREASNWVATFELPEAFQ